jgi:protein phosphatase
MQFLRNLLGLAKSSDSTPTPPALPTVPSSKPRLEVGWATDVGEVRHHNEDAALVLTAEHGEDSGAYGIGIFILADGMGGQHAGEVASSVATRIVAYTIVRQFYLPILIGQEHHADQPALNEVLVSAVQSANSAVADQVPGAGTTLTCALVLESRAYVAHVGDSRAYVVTGEGLSQITHDHSLVDRLVELGQLTRDEATIHPQKNVLYRAVGQSGTLEVDTSVHVIPRGGRLLLCSDGLWTMVSEAEMSHIIATAPSLQEACNGLIAAANRAGGPDNITVILVAPPVE